MDKEELNRKLREDIQAEEDDLLLGKTKNRRYVVAACSASIDDSKFYIDSNGPAIESDYDCRLISRVRACFGGKTIGEYSGLETWPIGQCAEQHAANKTLKNNPCNAVITDFQFSDALKTLAPDLPFPYCENCKTIFPQLK